jgi:hypothetical protein
VCCETHDLRDYLAAAHGEALPLAPGDDHRCRCSELGRHPGVPCNRYADGEDILCPWCRETNHLNWYYAASADPLAAGFYGQQGVPWGGPGGYGAETVRGSSGLAQFQPPDPVSYGEAGQGMTEGEVARYIRDVYGRAAAPDPLKDATRVYADLNPGFVTGRDAMGNEYTVTGRIGGFEFGARSLPSGFTPQDLSALRAWRGYELPGLVINRGTLPPVTGL